MNSWRSEAAAWSILVHGGAGDVPPRLRELHRRGCEAASEAGAKVLASGGASLDAVEQAVRVLEADPCFNAATGGSLTRLGTLELDAAIMDGATLRAGAVSALSPFAHPISVAGAVLTDGRHVMLVGQGADDFACQLGMRPVEPELMITVRAKEKLAEALRSGRAQAWAGGTVGAVACDRRGSVAAATSTGGTSGKLPGRVGDSPLIGAGTYADNQGGAVSVTGEGEAITRLGLARVLVWELEGGMKISQAAELAIERLGKRLDALGGVVVAAPSAELAWARNTATMAWAALRQGVAMESGC